MVNSESILTKDMLVRFVELNRRKKDLETELEKLKDLFHQYFDTAVGQNEKGEVTIDNYKLQRQIRKLEKFDQETTVQKLEKLNFLDLIQKRPDEGKIKSALDLGLIKEQDLEGCRMIKTTGALLVKQLDR
ncbi:hypothetical protein [Cytobacillus oceanisediminis]|uniref:Uncharacterized protein n=1 Tax=Cytobacillus oceanisediminis TaxID=665099 RepID=A0A562JWN9_9BACI|nr:hypothetical protein [Cytobacillus oceanisediminis]TWH87579.1 hypothetical protein IQ19_01821 [Cytobacillus oceanisediminis]